MNDNRSIVVQQLVEGMKLFIGSILFIGLWILLLFTYAVYNETFHKEKERMERRQRESRAFLRSSTCTNYQERVHSGKYADSCNEAEEILLIHPNHHARIQAVHHISNVINPCSQKETRCDIYFLWFLNSITSYLSMFLFVFVVVICFVGYCVMKSIGKWKGLQQQKEIQYHLDHHSFQCYRLPENNNVYMQKKKQV